MKIPLHKIIRRLDRFLSKLRIYIAIGEARGWRNVSSNGDFIAIAAEKLDIKGALYINEYCYINAMGGIELGDSVVLSAGSKLISAGLDLRSNRRAQGGHTSKPIVIGNNVWIGAGAVILPGVSVGNNSIIAAGAVVTSSVPESAVFAGVPARMISNIKLV